jgi:cytochrome c oxidase subunit 3
LPDPSSAATAEHWAHQFESFDHQKEVSLLGMWVFLTTEILFFGGMFLAYSIYRHAYPGAFAAASHEMIVWAGTINTTVLITSSLTMALAVHAAAAGQRRALLLFLTITILLGFVFLGIKAYEYRTEYLEHHLPGSGFQFEAPYAQPAQIFFSLYFMMTGLHALHMVIGIGIMLVMMWLSWRGTITAAYSSPIEISGLYWHFVDIVWIFLFPLLYLVGRHVH